MKLLPLANVLNLTGRVVNYYFTHVFTELVDGSILHSDVD